MRIGDVMDDLGRALGDIAGLRVFPYWAREIHAPAAIVGWPDPVEYDLTMRRGADRLSFVIMLCVGNADSRSSRDVLSAYLDSAGPQSVKRVIDEHVPFAYDSARVQKADVAIMTIAAVDYLSATFRVDIIGKGA